MNKQEFANIAVAIKAAYPNSNAIPDSAAMNLWYRMLQDLDYKLVENAVLEHISTNKFPPSIADIREKSSERLSPDVSDWGTAWGQVMTAIRKYGYYQETEALASMDELTRKVVQRFGYQNLCMSDNIVADRAHFSKVYEGMLKEYKNSKQLPSFVLTDKQRLIEGIVHVTAAALTDKEDKREIHKPNLASTEEIDRLLQDFRKNGLKK